MTAQQVDNGLILRVQRWSLWQLAGSGTDATWLCADAEGIRSRTLDAPTLSDLPAMKRRRLSPLARVTFQTLGFCADTGAQEPVVFSSTFGEIQRTQGMLEAIAASDPVSPTAFSHSVHNAIGGLWSQMHGITAPMLALAPCDDSPVPALLEGAGLLQEGHYSAVNVVYAEENCPGFYQPWYQGPPAPCALALRLVAGANATVALRLNADSAARPPAPPSRQPAPVPGAIGSGIGALTALLQGERSRADITETGAGWRLERC
ncbi:beta-ketoacyl synthase chain length factor [Parahaliea mediterranea]|uniref:beta-ketoacyl synthase chain length factor n=1 Tax=Parahaliea mediterranea TaxID=651086 RepID=UPI000E2EB894|nr:beta-ketoacyl synthase chain length factor [Parahaliea mediterranea]